MCTRMTAAATSTATASCRAATAGDHAGRVHRHHSQLRALQPGARADRGSLMGAAREGCLRGRQLGHPFSFRPRSITTGEAPLLSSRRLRSSPSRLWCSVKRATRPPSGFGVCCPLTSRRGHPCLPLLPVPDEHLCDRLCSTAFANLHVQGGIVRLVSASRKRRTCS